MHVVTLSTSERRGEARQKRSEQQSGEQPESDVRGRLPRGFGRAASGLFDACGGLLRLARDAGDARLCIRGGDPGTGSNHLRKFARAGSGAS